MEIGVFALRFVAAWAACLLSGLCFKEETAAAVRGWYGRLRRPPFIPPNVVFPFAWNALYVLMALAFAFAQRSPNDWVLTALWWLQPPLMLLWTSLFFVNRLLLPAVAVVGVMIISTAFFVRRAFDLDAAAAGALMLPYLLWISFAFYMNAAFAALNQ